MANCDKPSTELTKLEYALIHSIWEPSKMDIDAEVFRDRQNNPHNDSYKPAFRSHNEIVMGLKVKYLKSLLNFDYGKL